MCLQLTYLGVTCDMAVCLSIFFLKLCLCVYSCIQVCLHVCMQRPYVCVRLSVQMHM